MKGRDILRNLLVAFLLAYGLYNLAISGFPLVYAPAAKALNRRGPKKLTQTQIAVNRLAKLLEPRIELDPIKRSQTEQMLKTLGHTQSPEEFHARAIAQGLVIAAMLIWLPLFSVPLGVVAILLVFLMFYNREMKTLQKELAEHRQKIERELPQFASTIQQTLNTTRDLVAILSNYRKICGEALASEIDKTLNDIMTGNAPKAIKALACVNSPKLSQLTRGLQAVLRGDDQRIYFEMLAGEYRRAQDEEIEKMLLQRPKQLHPFMAVLFVCLALMIAASLGADIVNQISGMF